VLLALSVLCATVSATAVATATGGGASAPPPPKATLVIKGKATMKVNRFIKDGMRFGRNQLPIRSDGTLTVRNKTPEPHTVSAVKKSDLPRNVNGIGKCYEGGPCGTINEAHGVPPEGGDPTKPVVDVGAPGFGEPGDSVVTPPKSTTKIKITAKRGTKLHILCIIHPWMQTLINVK
jgi:hypothetical protein